MNTDALSEVLREKADVVIDLTFQSVAIYQAWGQPFEVFGVAPVLYQPKRTSGLKHA